MENAAKSPRQTEQQIEEAITARVQEFFCDQPDDPLSQHIVNEHLRDLLSADAATQAIFLQSFPVSVRQHPHFEAVLSSAQLSA